MFTLKQSIIALSAGVFLTSCSTDFDIITPEYEDHTVVFGLLDLSETTHFVKINKTFLGPGNANIYASIRDSSEYDEVLGTVDAYNGSALVASYPLMDTLITSKDSGLFYYPEQTVYYFNATLNQNYTYRLNVQLFDGSKEVSAETELVKDFTFYATTQSVFLPYTLANASSSVDGIYPDYSVKFSTGQNGKRYDTWLHFRYDEYTASGVERKTVTWKIDTYLPITTSGGEDVTITFNGKTFYQMIANRLDPDPSVIKRVARSMDIEVVGAGDDLYTFMQINEPSSGLIQEKPAFTNVANGIGLFSSRYTKRVIGKVLGKDSQKELCSGPFTYDLQFCTDSTVWASEPWYCP